MGKKTEKVKKRKKFRIDPKDYEGFSYGPFEMERFGRTVRMSSRWDPVEYRKHMDRIRKGRPEHKRQINEKIDRLLSIIGEFDPIELLTTVSMRNTFIDPETYKESTDDRREAYVEYALSLALSQKISKTVKHATKEAIEEFNKLIEEVFNDITWYFGSEVTEGKHTKEEEELRFFSLLRYLYVRGDSFLEHHLYLVKGVFGAHDDFLRNNCGLDSEQIIKGIENIEEQLLKNIDEQRHFWSIGKELHQTFKDFVKKEGIESFSSPDDIKEKYNALPAVKVKMKEIEKFRDNINTNPFNVKPTEEVPLELLELLSSEFGDNEPFASFERSPAWPTNDSVVYDRPLIKVDGNFYCFSPQIMFRRIGDILEGWIKAKDADYYENRFLKRRAAFLEEKSLEYFRCILPGAEAFSKMYYWIEKDGERKKVETDGLVLYDENIFIIEAKSGSLSTSARRGGLKRMSRDTKELIDHAYEQALRTKEFITESAEPVFEFEDGTDALVITDKNIYKNIYIVNVTFDHLGHLSTQLNSLKTFNLIQGKEWPWSVFINDLRVITEVIEFPSVFLHFLQRRIRANDYPQFRVGDELDFLMFYFREGLYFEDGVLQGADTFTPHAYTEPLDRYYDYLAGRVSSGERPRLEISRELKELLRQIEATGKERFTRVTTRLLSFDWKVQKEMLEQLKKMENDSLENGKDHDFTLQVKGEGIGITFSTSANRTKEDVRRLENYCKLKMYQTKIDEWILICTDVQKDREREINFRIYDKKWEYDALMEERLKKFKDLKLTEFKKSGRKKVGRNEPCPCNSGLKFKKCCGR